VCDLILAKDRYSFKNFIGYPSSPYVIRQFDEPDIATATPENQHRMRQFNKRLSSIRIVSEHAFRMLKGHFLSLKEMGKHKNIQDMYKAIEVMMILHNICIDWDDQPEQIWGYDPLDHWGDNEEDLVDDNVGSEDIDGDVQVPAYEMERWLKVVLPRS